MSIHLITRLTIAFLDLFLLVFDRLQVVLVALQHLSIVPLLLLTQSHRRVIYVPITVDCAILLSVYLIRLVFRHSAVLLFVLLDLQFHRGLFPHRWMLIERLREMYGLNFALGGATSQLHLRADLVLHGLVFLLATGDYLIVGGLLVL